MYLLHSDDENTNLFWLVIKPFTWLKKKQQFLLVLLSLHAIVSCTVHASICLCIFTVNGVSTVVGHVADKMAPHIKKQGAKLVPESMKKNKDSGPSNWDGAKFVAISSVQGMNQCNGEFRIKHEDKLHIFMYIG